MFNKDNQKLLEKYKRNLKPTESENLFESYLKELGLYYKKQKAFMSKLGRKFYIVDFYLPKPHKLVIEIDGLYHQDQQEYDQERTKYLTDIRNLRVLRFTNQEVEDKEYIKQVLVQNTSL